MRKIKFPRPVVPLKWQLKEPILMIFGDGSREACFSLVDIRWKQEDGHVKCRLVTGKTQITPKMKITIPRMELVAAVNSVRSTQKFEESLRMLIKKVKYFMYSSCCIQS